MIIDLDMLEDITPDNLNKLAEMIKEESSQLENEIKNKKVYIEDISNNKYFIKNLDEYLEYKNCGYIIKRG